MAGEVFTIRPLQLYAVTQQLLQGKPTCANGDAKTDLGHILDFTCRLKYLKVSYACTNTGDVFYQTDMILSILLESSLNAQELYLIVNACKHLEVNAKCLFFQLSVQCSSLIRMLILLCDMVSSAVLSVEMQP